MKMLSLFLSLIVSAPVFAEDTVVLKGYVNLDRRGNPHYVSVDIPSLELTAALPLYNFFSEADIRKMYKCMEKKTTHAITVDKVPDIQEGVPTGIEGRTTTTHFPRFENIKCVKAPGFLDVWRAIVSRSSFR